VPTRSAPTAARGRPPCTWPSRCATPWRVGRDPGRGPGELTPIARAPDFRLALSAQSACSAWPTTRSTFYLVLPAPTLTVGLPELGCLSRTTLAFRPPPDYGSGGQPAWWPVPHIGVPFRSDTLAGWWTVLLPAVQRGRCRSAPVPAAVAGCPPCRGVPAPGVRQAMSGVHPSGQPSSPGCVDLTT
jgi:hypothetical protein